MNAKQKIPRRQIFVLTSEEKKAIAFILCALVFGAATKHYRDAHPRPPRPLSIKEQRAAKRIAHSNVSPSPHPATPDTKSPAGTDRLEINIGKWILGALVLPKNPHDPPALAVIE